MLDEKAQEQFLEVKKELTNLEKSLLELKEGISKPRRILEKCSFKETSNLEKIESFYYGFATLVEELEQFIGKLSRGGEKKEFYKLYARVGFLKEGLLLLRENARSINEAEVCWNSFFEKCEQLLIRIKNEIVRIDEFLKGIQEKTSFYDQIQELNLKILEVQEDEKRRLSLEIHDGPAQAIANIVMQLEYIKKLYQKKPELAEEELENLISFARDTLKNVRNYIFSLRPMTLDDFGLVYTIRRFLENLKKVKKDVNFNFKLYGDEDRRFKRDIEISLFRIIQEAVNNSLKHAEASNINISLYYSDSWISVSVEDNGKGFDITKLEENYSKRGSYGLLGMKERAQLISGEFKMSSQIGKGTKVEVKVRL